MIIAGADVTLERTVVREGRGLAGVVHPDTGTPSTIALRSSLVERTSDIAVKLSGGEATVEASVIRETQPTAEPASGRGINAQSDTRMGQPATLSVRGSVIEKNYDSGVFLSGVNATIETSVVRDTVKWASPDLVIVVSNPAPASATITATRIEKSTLAAIAAWGAHAAVGRSALVCQAFDLDRETFEGREAALEDLGRNTCGCPDPTGPC